MNILKLAIFSGSGNYCSVFSYLILGVDSW